MRALLDANLFISYLLSRNPRTSAVGAILEAAAEERFVLLYTSGIADELVPKLTERPDLARRITPSDLEELLAGLVAIAETVPQLPGPIPAISRDAKDDYLIAHARAGSADVLVSWDKDLRDLHEVAGLRIMNPPEFLHALRDAGLIQE